MPDPTTFDPRPTSLRGTFVHLEPLTDAHTDALFEAGKHPEIWTHTAKPPVRTRDDAASLVAGAIAERDAGRQVPFVTIDARTGRVVGSTRYLDIQRENRGLEIGHTWLTPSAQRTAVNTEQKLLLLRHAFAALGAVRVQLRTDALNLVSQRAIERIGATREGTLRRNMIVHTGRLRDTAYFSVLSDEWPAVEARLVERLSRGA